MVKVLTVKILMIRTIYCMRVCGNFCYWCQYTNVHFWVVNCSFNAQYSDISIYRVVCGKENIRGKSGFCWFTIYIVLVKPYLGEGGSRGKSEFHN